MHVFLRSLRYLTPYKGMATGAFVSMLVVTLATLYVPQIYGNLVDSIDADDWNGILIACGSLLVVAIVRGFFNYFSEYGSAVASQGMAYDLRRELFTKLQSLSFSYYDTHKIGQLMTRTTSDVGAIVKFYGQGILQLISAVLTFIGCVVLMLMIDPRLVVAGLATVPLIMLTLVLVFRRMGPLYWRIQQSIDVLNNILQENIVGVRVIKSFTAEPQELKRYSDQNEVVYQRNLKVPYLFSLGFPTALLLTNLATLLVLWFGGNLVISDKSTFSLGDLVTFMSYLAFLIQPIFQFGSLSQGWARANASGGRIFQVLDAKIDIADKPGAQKLPEKVPGRITFENVHFQYAGDDSDILSDVSFDIQPGQTVALLGITGSGKSTIVNLIPRFYDPSQGRVLIDGVDVRDIQVESLRSRICTVLQGMHLTSGTIRHNIRYGRSNATDEEVEQAARIAQAYDFIMEQPDGFDTVLGERGTGLSGGQRERVAIARAIVVDPAILILDDSTSALDVETERKLQEALEPLLADRTTVIVAQRISTVRDADLILLVDKERIVAQGTHEELRHNSPLYNEIIESQLEDDKNEKRPANVG
ncbi:MAG: ABC transporter ATP-binding protein [Candidatus Promineifilaceae bacterium]|nr:ABC transporter ATP-binding protein [Candidatus Promineifilaceae bacterium]